MSTERSANSNKSSIVGGYFPFGGANLRYLARSHGLVVDRRRRRHELLEREPAHGRQHPGKAYSDLYGLLTTKSNTFQVHYRVQSLQHPAATVVAENQWVENPNLITGERRGSVTIERYLDLNPPTPDKAAYAIPDYAANPGLSVTHPIENFYQFRVVNSTVFNP